MFDENEAPEEDDQVDYDGEEGDEDGENGEEGRDGKKLVLIIAGVVILLLVAGAGLFFSGALDGLLGKHKAAEEVIDGEEDGKGEEEKYDKKEDKHDKNGAGNEEYEGDEGDEDGKGEKKGSSLFVKIPTMQVGLNSDEGVPRYLRLSVQLELKDPSASKGIEAIMPRIVDQFQTYLRELRVRDLRGSGGIYRMQAELLWRVNQAAAPIEVKDVLFQEILIQ